MIPLSILDLSGVTTGTKPAAALRNSIDLARHADALGYVRYWLAEHHNLASVASPAPDLMIGQIAAVTSRIRVGSGGVMLPNHAPLVVAERFKMLEAPVPAAVPLSRGGGGRARTGCGSRETGVVDGSQSPAPRPRPVHAAAQRRGSAGVSLYGQRTRLDRPQPFAAVRRLAGNGDGE